MWLADWAKRWGVPLVAVEELRAGMGLDAPDAREFASADSSEQSEAGAQSRIRLEAANLGLYLWRNNSGACYDERGRFIRYGLGNDSKALNERFKSHDLIGIRAVRIQPEHVGHVIGQFMSREVKTPGWRYAGTPREVAQNNFAELINRNGGDAAFTTGELKL